MGQLPELVTIFCSLSVLFREKVVMDGFAGYFLCLLVLVPRHPERFDGVYNLCQQAGWRVVRRSAGVAPEAGDDILLGDTMGELVLLLSTATVAVIGGSLVEHGGHGSTSAAPLARRLYEIYFRDFLDSRESA